MQFVVYSSKINVSFHFDTASNTYIQTSSTSSFSMYMSNLNEVEEVGGLNFEISLIHSSLTLKNSSYDNDWRILSFSSSVNQSNVYSIYAAYNHSFGSKDLLKSQRMLKKICWYF